MVKIKIINLYGNVEVIDLNESNRDHRTKKAENNKPMDYQKGFKIAIRSHQSSGGTIYVTKDTTEKINLPPNHVIKISDQKPKTISRLTKYISGYIWLRVNNLLAPDKDFDDEQDNATIGVRG